MGRKRRNRATGLTYDERVARAERRRLAEAKEATKQTAEALKQFPYFRQLSEKQEAH